ncbi:unnamed protein product [Ectocarpus sp. 8 AP-2014]
MLSRHQRTEVKGLRNVRKPCFIVLAGTSACMQFETVSCSSQVSQLHLDKSYQTTLAKLFKTEHSRSTRCGYYTVNSYSSANRRGYFHTTESVSSSLDEIAEKAERNQY